MNKPDWSAAHVSNLRMSYARGQRATCWRKYRSPIRAGVDIGCGPKQFDRTSGRALAGG